MERKQHHPGHASRPQEVTVDHLAAAELSSFFVYSAKCQVSKEPLSGQGPAQNLGNAPNYRQQWLGGESQGGAKEDSLLSE